MEIYVDGVCPECGHLMSRRVEATITEDQLRGELCSSCKKGFVEFEKLTVHHTVKKKPAKLKIRAALMYMLLALIITSIGIVTTMEIKIHKTYNSEQIMTARKASLNISCPEILREFTSKSSLRVTARLLKSEPSVIQRLMKNESLPTKAYEIALRSAYADYILYHRSWITICWKYRFGRFDPYTGAINRQQEQKFNN